MRWRYLKYEKALLRGRKYLENHLLRVAETELWTLPVVQMSKYAKRHFFTLRMANVIRLGIKVDNVQHVINTLKNHSREYHAASWDSCSMGVAPKHALSKMTDTPIHVSCMSPELCLISPPFVLHVHSIRWYDIWCYKSKKSGRNDKFVVII